MYCPNCAKENSTEQKFCRACGLNLEKMAENLQEQLSNSDVVSPSKISKFFETLGKMGFGGLMGAGLVGIILVIVKLFNKFILSGEPEKILMGIIFIILIVSGVLGLAYIIYQSYLEQKSKSNPVMQPQIESRNTAKLLEEQSFEPISSVTERTTNLLFVEAQKKTSGELK